MDPIPGFQFRRLLRAMDAESFERFVVDLWRARGYTVERDGDALVAENPALGERLTLEVRAVPAWRPRAPSDPPADADVAVVNRRVPSASDTVVDAPDLLEMLQYAVDPATRVELFEAHLDRSGSTTRWMVRRVPPVTPARLGTVVVAVAVLLAAAVGGLIYLDEGGPASGLGEADGDTSPAAGVDLDSPEAFAALRWPGSDGGFPPGLAGGGVTDPEALASAHSRQVANQSYELTLTVREFEYGQQVGSYRERIAVRNQWTFVSSITTVGTLRGSHPAFSGVEMFAREEGVYVHVEPDRSMDRQTALRASPGDLTGLEARVEGFLVEALTMDDSRVAENTQLGDTTFHRVHGTDMVAGGENETVTSVVTSDGTVHEVKVEGDVAGTDRTFVVTLEYAFGSVTIERPEWVANESATAGRDLPSGSSENRVSLT